VTVPPAGRRRLASGALTVGVGLTATGIGTIVMMAVSARSLSPDAYAAFAVWWTMATLLGTSFGVFEAYLARLVVTEVAGGRHTGEVTGLIAGRAVAVTGVLVAVLLALAPWFDSRLFGGSLSAALILPLFVGLSATQAVQRGAATGHSRFRAIAGQLATDGIVRAVLTTILVVAGLDSITTLALAACISAAAGLVVGGLMCPQWLARPRLRGARVSSKPLLLLLVGSVGPLLVNNGSVPWLAGSQAVGAYTLGAFAGAITISRLPTQFVSAAFGPLLAQLSHCVEAGDKKTFDRLRKTADLAAGVLGLLFVAAFAVAGPWVLSAYLGPAYQLSVLNLSILAAASGLMFVTVVQQAALAALDRWSTIAVAWLVGTLAFGIALLMPVSPLLRAAGAPLVAVLTALLVMTASRHRWGANDSAIAAGSSPDGPNLANSSP
jgi:O-antigen/teichoic acid export membrane protein